MSSKGLKTKAGYITWSDVKKLLQGLENDGNLEFLLLFAVGFFTALRISDILNLKWEDVRGDFIKVTEKKTGKVRQIAVHKDLKRIIELCDDSEKGYIWDIGTNYVNKMIKILFLKYKIKCYGNASSHLFRKTFGRAVVENSNSKMDALILLMDAFNHSSPAITKTYLGIRQDEIDELYTSLPKLDLK